jgi:hypothetical protein
MVLADVLRVPVLASSTARVPAVVDAADLTEANARLEVSRSAATLSGPGLAGALIAAARAPVALLLDADLVRRFGAAAGACPTAHARRRDERASATSSGAVWRSSSSACP